MTTTFLPVRLLTPETPLALTVQADGNYSITSNSKQLVITVPLLIVKPCVNAKNQPFLVLDEKQETVLAALNQIRSRCVEMLKLEDASVRPVLTAGKGLLNKRLSLFLNITPTAQIDDLDKRAVDYNSLVGKTCKMILFAHLQSVHKSPEGYSLQVKVSQMVLQEAPKAETKVEQINPTDCDDTAANL